MIADILKAVIVGICLAAPVGPVIVTVLQKSLTYGRNVGLKAGLGCAVMDTFYAALSFIALAFIRGLLEGHSLLFALIGGIVVIILGVSMYFSDPLKETRMVRVNGNKAFWQVVLTILTNPGSILYDFTVCSFFGLEAKDWRLVLLAAGVFAGEMLFWYIFTLIFGHFHKSFKEQTLYLVCRLSGVALCVCGLVIMIKGFV